MAEKIDPVKVGLGILVGLVVLRAIKANWFNPFSDKNMAYQGADSLAKAILGDKATLTDFVPGINKTNATTTPTSAKLLALSFQPPPAAPYWYNRDGSKRTGPMTRGGTVYSADGQLMQITDTATQMAAYVSALGTV